MASRINPFGPVPQTASTRWCDRLLDGTLLVSLLALASYLRLAQLDLAEFKFDEALALNLAADILDVDPFTTIGLPSSLGITNSSAFSYLMAVPLLLSRDPVVATGFIALLNILAVGASFLLVRKWFGLGASLISTLLFALSPWSVIFSRKIQAQHTLSLFSIIIVATLLLYDEGRRPWWAIGSLVTTSLAVLIHPPAATLGLVVLIAFAASWRKASRLPAGIGAALSFLAFTPFLFREAAQGWPALAAVLGPGLSSPSLDLQVVELYREMTAGFGYPSLTGQAYPTFDQLRAQIPWVNSVVSVLAAAAPVYLIAAGLFHARDSAGWRRLVIGLGTATPLAALVYHPFPLHIHYLIPVLPLAFVAIGILTSDAVALLAVAGDSWRRPAATVAWASSAVWLVLLGVTQIRDHRTFLDFVRTHETPGGYGLAIAEVEEIAQSVAASQPGGDVFYNVRDRSLTEALRYLLRGRYVLRQVEEEASPLVLVIRSHPTALLLEPSNTPTIRAVADDLAPQRIGELEYERGAKRLTLYSIRDDLPCELCKLSQPPPATLGGQLAFEVARLHRVDEARLMVVQHWRLGRRPTGLPAELSVFNHVLDRDGTKVAQADGLGQSAAEWSDGGWILYYHQVSLPSDRTLEECYLLTGFYRWDTGERFQVERNGLVSDRLQVGPYCGRED